MAKSSLRIFLIGYIPPGWGTTTPLESNLPLQRKLFRLMDASDVAAAMPDGWPVGESASVDGNSFICIEHEHDGKVVLVKPIGTVSETQ